MNGTFLRSFAKPEYFLRPRQLMRRLARGRTAAVPSAAIVDLPWGHALEVSPRETIGGGLWRLGVHELVVSEVLWRLIDAGETVADVGANSGYFTSLMAARAGAGATIWSFEPHPEMHARLARQVGLWHSLTRDRRIELLQVGLSDVDGRKILNLPPGFDTNTGTAYIADGAAPASGNTGFDIETRRLDSLVSAGIAPAVVKIDVEGHEAQVLAGAGDLLSPGNVRDIVFEEHRPYPAESLRLLERRGYSIYLLGRGIFRPLLRNPETAREAGLWEAPNYLATLDPERVRKRFLKAGWTCLGSATRASR